LMPTTSGINTYKGKTGRLDERTRKLVVGPIPQLRGCVNDARLIEAAVQPIAASMRVLVDSEATAASFRAAWTETLTAASAGDVVLLTFAGHGGLEVERPGDNKPTGYNPAFLFTDFDQSTSNGTSERVLSYEIGQLFQGALARGIRVLFVADCCHFGTGTRSMDPRDADVAVRSVRSYDVGPLTLAVQAPLQRQDLPPERPNVMYFSGSLDNETVPEIELRPGVWHGALSVAFTRAVSGIAARKPDGAVTAQELRSFVNQEVRIITDSAQHPKISPPHHDIRFGMSADSVVLIAKSGSNAPAFGMSGAPVRLRILALNPAEAARIAASLSKVILTEDGSADLIWDASSGECISVRQKIAESVTAALLQPVVERVRALAALQRLASGRTLTLRLLRPGDRPDSPSPAADAVHAPPMVLSCEITGQRYTHLAMFNITGNGTVQRLFPLDKDPQEVKVGRPHTLRNIGVTAPFGSDHLVAVSSAEPLTALNAELARLDQTKGAAAAIAALEQTAARGDVQIGFQGIFTAAK
jgi:Caspase domain